MEYRQSRRIQRVKLLLIFIAFAAPMIIAWSMVTWGIGIPQSHTAHGQVHLSVPRLDTWPLNSSSPSSEKWTLVFDCDLGCEQKMDELWRLHRALGREAIRVQRLRIGGDAKALPGEVVSRWQETPEWINEHSVWLFDPMGRPALAFRDQVPAADILDDIRHLLKVNPL